MLDLRDRVWKEFDLRQIFPDIQRGKRLKTADHISGSVPYVSSSAANNGVYAFIGNYGKVRKFNECLTLANSGSVGKTFYHCYEFIASDHVTALKSPALNKYSYLFIATIVQRLDKKYSFNREINDVRINKEKIVLPVDESGLPDYAFMEQYIKERELQLIQKYISFICGNAQIGEHITSPDRKQYKAFRLLDLFSFTKGNQNNMVDLKQGGVPLVSARNVNNGYKNFVSRNFKSVFNGNCITINNDGDGGAGISYYQPCDMLLDTHVTALYPKADISPNAMLFISACITTQQAKFGHGYPLNNSRLSVLRIMLPVTDDKKPDYAYMDQYIRERRQQLLQKYIAFKS